MTEQIFPTAAPGSELPTEVFVVEPYRHNGVWVFDDPAVGLVREPFVSGIDDMIDILTARVPFAARGFRLLFAAHPFEGYQACLTWDRADPVEGNWYRWDGRGLEGWLCPALFCYFPEAPPKIYWRAKPKE